MSEYSKSFFGTGGIGTYGDVSCDFCKMKHNVGEDKRGVYDGDSVSVSDFAGLQVCGCCFERIENAVLELMPSILPWYKKILDEKEAELKADREALNAVLEEV